MLDGQIDMSDMFDAMLDQRKIYLFGDITIESVLSIISQIHILEHRSKKQDIELIINSDGGCVPDCLAIIDAMDSSPCEIKTLVLGRALSAACLIASNGTPGKRCAGRNAEFMYHEICETIGDVKPSHMRYYKQETSRLAKKFNGIFSRNTGRTIKEIEDIFLKKEIDIWLYAKEAKDFGIIDKIVSSKRKDIKLKHSRKNNK